MSVKVINNFSTTLANALVPGATSLVMAAGAGNTLRTKLTGSSGTAFGTAGGTSDYLYMTLADAGGVIEIVKVTSIAATGDTATIVRGVDGTVSRATNWAAGSLVDARPCAAFFTDALMLLGTTAAAVSFNNAASGMAADTVQEAIDEMDAGLFGLPNADGNFLVGNGTGWSAESGAIARASMGAANEAQCAHTTASGIRIPRPLSAGADLSTILEAGTYNLDANASANTPVAGLSWIFLDVYRHTNTTVGSEYVVQVCWDMNAVNTEPRAWVRKATPGLTWSPWRALLNTNRTWKNALLGVGGRANNATIVNTNAHELIFLVTGATPAAADAYGTLNLQVNTGAGWYTAGYDFVTSRGSAVTAGGHAVVPPGASYKAVATGLTLTAWNELS